MAYVTFYLQSGTKHLTPALSNAALLHERGCSLAEFILQGQAESSRLAVCAVGRLVIGFSFYNTGARCEASAGDPNEVGSHDLPALRGNVADHSKFCGDCGSPLPWKCKRLRQRKSGGQTILQ